MNLIRFLFRTTCSLTLSLGCLVQAQLTPEEKKAIADTLFLGNLTVRDLQWERKAFTDPYRLGLVDLSLDNPLEAADTMATIHAKAGRSAYELLTITRRDILGDPDTVPLGASGLPEITLPENIPQGCREPLRALIAALARTKEVVHASISALSPDEQRTLLEGLPKWAAPEFDYEFVKGKTEGPERLLALLKKADLPRIRLAAQRLAVDLDGPMRALKRQAATETFSERVKFNTAGLTIVFCGVGNDEHTDRNAQLTVDLGGNDRYTGRHGAGPGYASVLIDLGGDDTYDVPDLSMGAAVLGIGLAYDLGGHDRFRGGSITFGAGLAGVGLFYKEGGDDDYRSKAMTQGYGFFGIGICVDTSGRDTYLADMNAQGAAATQGAGWLIDRAGDDTYRAGGVVLNSPLFKDIHYSNAQGFGTGFREDTGGLSGGVGMLTDLGGDDAYLGETYCQAASYWFGLGSLYDAAGHDTYRAYHYAQSSAMHLCGAFLFDLAGDDIYSTAFGACHAIGHDYGVAFLLDRDGNDLYASRDSSPGTGNANGLGLFVDASGDDRYIGSPAAGNPARGTGSLGVFVDMNGTDRFLAGLSNGAARADGEWAVALDQESVLGPQEGGGPSQRTLPTPGSRQLPSDAAMEELYRRATQWTVGTAVQDANAALDELIAIGAPALNWMIDRKLVRASRLEQRAFAEVAKGIGPDGRNKLASVIASGNKDLVLPALGACIDGGFKEAGAYLPKALQNPETARLAARAAGLLGGPECVSDLMVLCASKDPMTVLAALVSLGQLGDPNAYGTASAFVSSESLPIRKAAMTILSKSPVQAMASARLMMEDSTESRVRSGIELLAMIGSPEAIQAICQKLTDSRAGVRIQALLALDGRCPIEFRPAFLKLREDSHPLVRAVAARTDVGR